MTNRPGVNRRTVILSAGAMAALSVPAFSAETFNPPLWVVRRGSAKAYLFGEMFTDRDFGPSPKVVAAFNESAEFWKETPPVNPQVFKALLAQFGQADTPLTDRLDAADARRLLSAAAAVKVPAESLQSYRPWLVVQTLQGPLFRSLGVMVHQDAGVTVAARTQSKRLRYEFPDEQALVGYFAGMSTDTELEYLRWSIATFEEGREPRLKLSEAWAIGDLPPLEADVRRMAKDYPALYTSIITARNKAWVPHIREMLQGDATSFVMVGALHLFGPDSIQQQLTRSGLTAERIA